MNKRAEEFKNKAQANEVSTKFFDYYDGGNGTSNGAWVNYTVGEATKNRDTDWLDEPIEDEILDIWLRDTFNLINEEQVFIHHWW